MAISLCRVTAASGVLLLGCGGGAATPAGGPAPSTAIQVVPAAALLRLELAGIPAEDSTVVFKAGRARTVILRHGPPDNAVFLELLFPPSAFDSTRVDSVTLTLQPMPGIYGVLISSSLPPDSGARIRFKYPVHFSAPADAVGVYGSTVRYERALRVARGQTDGSWALLPSSRPASDNLEADFTGSGRYVVAATREP